MNNQTKTCPICGKAYTFASHMVGDQSICSDCREAGRKAVKAPDTEEQKRRRREHFGGES